MKPIFIAMMILLSTSAISDSEVNNYDATPEICHLNPVIEEQQIHGNYKTTISRADDGNCHFIDIEKDGLLLYHDEQVGAHFYFGSDLEQNTNPNLVFSKWTGGAHCCYSLHIFELGNELNEIANIDGGNFAPELIDLDQDGIPEIKVWDDFLAYRFSCFADSAIGHVILKYSGEGYKVASEYMQKPAPNLNSLTSKIDYWRNLLQKRKDLENLPRSFMQAVTNLAFTGNKQTAMELIERVWPPDFPGKEDFLKSYNNALYESKFYPEFEKQL